ncbi:MAG: hypothetical protein GX751_09300 [Desulfuromonadaceae bacterium]|nr:hypothetical protein [Desulfuromonadaceae bacterium]
MNKNKNTNGFNMIFDLEDFSIASLQDEIAVDELCSRLLRIFYEDLTSRQAIAADEAGMKARGADYFLRDYVISDRRLNIFEVTAQEITAFAGNWYIMKNLEPNIKELAAILDGVESFYRFCLTAETIGEERFRELAEACARTAYYHQRIENFWAITGDGYFLWNAACPMKK